MSFIGTVQDITERKEQQEREHLLMREINHRAQNMLSVVDAIARQTATKTPEDFIERFSESCKRQHHHASELRSALSLAAGNEAGIGKTGLAIRLTEPDVPPRQHFGKVAQSNH